MNKLIESRKRNWRIFKLRGLYQQANMLSEPNREIVQLTIDLELSALGAETCLSRRIRRMESVIDELDKI